MALLLRLLPFILLVGAVVWVLRRKPRGPEVKCASCRHCGKLFDDGALCHYGSKETFKNDVYIQNCVDYAPRGMRR